MRFVGVPVVTDEWRMRRQRSVEVDWSCWVCRCDGTDIKAGSMFAQKANMDGGANAGRGAAGCGAIRLGKEPAERHGDARRFSFASGYFADVVE